MIAEGEGALQIGGDERLAERRADALDQPEQQLVQLRVRSRGGIDG
jgi:hypothetical protein